MLRADVHWGDQRHRESDGAERALGLVPHRLGAAERRRASSTCCAPHRLCPGRRRAWPRPPACRWRDATTKARRHATSVPSTSSPRPSRRARDRESRDRQVDRRSRTPRRLPKNYTASATRTRRRDATSSATDRDPGTRAAAAVRRAGDPRAARQTAAPVSRRNFAPGCRRRGSSRRPARRKISLNGRDTVTGGSIIIAHRT